MNVAVIVAAALAPWLRGLLFEIQPADPLTQAGVLLVLRTVAFVGAWTPARRAVRIDPTRALWMP